MNVSKTNESNKPVPLNEMFSHLGRPCTVPLIFALGERSYNIDIRELRSSIDMSDGKRLSEATISKCLSDLTQIGLVEGTVHAHSPSKAEYSLTSKGQQLYRHLLQIRLLTERLSLEQDYIDSISAC
ncbi:MAG: winged helix-turn-helix transcriptional regulator [Candidatus Thorarchaeota archaeon]